MEKEIKSMRRLAAWTGLLSLLTFFAMPAAADEKARQPGTPTTAETTIPGDTVSSADPPHVRQAVGRSLVFLEKEGLAWMKERKCIACHHGAFMLWSHNEARQR